MEPKFSNAMKKAVLFLLVATFGAGVCAQDKIPKIGVKWAPTGLVLGSLDFQGEYNFGKNSLTAKIGVPVNAHHTLQYDDRNADFNLKATSFLAGYRTYFSKKHMKGLYFEPYFKYVHQSGDGVGDATLAGEAVIMNFTNDYNGVGIGAQLGAQFLLGKRLVIDVFLIGPELNSSSNNFRAVEVSHTIPWNAVQASEAEQQIRDFVDKFPFVRNNTTIMVDQTNKTVSADFKGLLPGFRIGVSFGIVL